MDIVLIYILMLIIPIIASINIKITYKKYKNIDNQSGLTGYDVARLILDENGLNDMYIVETKGNLTDCYDPTRKTVKLSTDIYHGTSIASISVAAHECGHAVQDKENYGWFRVRKSIFPIVNIGTSISYIILFIGLFLSSINLIYLAIACVALGLLFELVTLPVELDASRRAKSFLQVYNVTDTSEDLAVEKTLRSAALTYVAAVLSAALEIIYLLMEFTDRK